MTWVLQALVRAQMHGVGGFMAGEVCVYTNPVLLAAGVGRGGARKIKN